MRFGQVMLTFMDKIGYYNNGVRYLLVVVDVAWRFSRVDPMRTNRDADTFGALKRKAIELPDEVWIRVQREIQTVLGYLQH